MSGRHTPVDPSPLGPINCNCACQRCLDGGCCMLPQPNPSGGYTFTATSTALGYACTSSGHDFLPYPTGGLYCRKCAEFRQPHRATPKEPSDG